jgi:hypothetical protein
VASIELTDVQSEMHLTAHTKDLSLFGCYVSTVTPFPESRKVILRILHFGSNFFAHGKVVHSRPNAGMGITFTAIEPSSAAVLDKWLASLRM